MVDTHAHLVHTDFDEDRGEAIRRARVAGVSGIINVGFDIASSRRAVEQAERYPGVFAAVGIHPHDAATWCDDSSRELEKLAVKISVVALGETGLDYHYEFSTRLEQMTVFRAHVRMARVTGLPLIIHNREADDDTLQILQDEADGEVEGVFHCFTSDRVFAHRCLDVGFYLGFTGIVTFTKSSELREIVSGVPMERLLIETDCPYLSPQGSRGQRNEPSRVVEVARTIAEVRSSSVEEVKEVTTGNALRLFPKMQPKESHLP